MYKKAHVKWSYIHSLAILTFDLQLNFKCEILKSDVVKFRISWLISKFLLKLTEYAENYTKIRATTLHTLSVCVYICVSVGVSEITDL